ncbi:uncharacterized protein RB166_006834 [Leptodactylus fuscus]
MGDPGHQDKSYQLTGLSKCSSTDTKMCCRDNNTTSPSLDTLHLIPNVFQTESAKSFLTQNIRAINRSHDYYRKAGRYSLHQKSKMEASLLESATDKSMFLDGLSLDHIHAAHFGEFLDGDFGFSVLHTL